MEDFIDATDMEEKRVCKNLEIKNIGEYHDLYVRKDPLLLLMCCKASEKCAEKLSFYPLKFLSALGLAWQAASKKTEVKSELLTDIDVILMVDEGIRGGICHAIHRYAKANNKYIKD